MTDRENLVPIYWRERLAGHLPMVEHIRLPMSEKEMRQWPLHLLIYSKSWLYQVRPNDFRLDLRDDKLAIIACDRLGPGDISLIVNFKPADDMFAPDTELEEIAAQVLREHGGQG